MKQAAIWAVMAFATMQSVAQAQVATAGYEADYEASGFIAPAGMPSPEAYYSRVEQAGFFGGGGPIASRMQGCDGGCGDMGCNGACGQGGCGPMGCGLAGYGDGCGQYGCNGSCEECGGGLLANGLFGRGARGGCGGCGVEGCGSCGGLTNFRFLCMFCRGGGCSVCQSIGRGYLLSCLGALMPYKDAGLCAQRWYDVSAELMLLSHTRGTNGQVLTTQGIAGTPVLRASDADDDDYEPGTRISTAFIFGAGGNIEATYLGGQEWDGSATATGLNNTATLYSFLSDFGVSPPNGFDDSDRSVRQTVTSYSTFHSAELNYRRRTVEQFCRFQGSWLVGMRYLRYDDDFGYATTGQFNNAGGGLLRFLNFSNGIDNKMFGAQAGFDLWWNVIAGVNLGIGVKGAWLDNNIDRHSSVFANSAGPGATPGTLRVEDGINKSTVMGEFEATMLYRISHSWTLKSQLYVLGIDDVAYGFDVTPAQNLFSAGVVPVAPIQTDSLTVQGVSFGAEYIW
ncbi:MAG: hypothetical protein ACO1RT_06570 [Planctomycetaceae bacterium]